MNTDNILVLEPVWLGEEVKETWEQSEPLERKPDPFCFSSVSEFLPGGFQSRQLLKKWILSDVVDFISSFSNPHRTLNFILVKSGTRIDDPSREDGNVQIAGYDGLVDLGEVLESERFILPRSVFVFEITANSWDLKKFHEQVGSAGVIGFCPQGECATLHRTIILHAVFLHFLARGARTTNTGLTALKRVLKDMEVGFYQALMKETGMKFFFDYEPKAGAASA